MVDGGSYTFRVRFADAADDDVRWRELLVQLEPFGYWVDVRTPGFLAVSAPPTHAQAIADYLDALGALSRWTAAAIPQSSPATQTHFPTATAKKTCKCSSFESG